MSVKQLSVFAENKNGSLYEITEILSKNNIDIRAFSVADTQSYGILRLIVSDARAAAYALSQEGKIVNVTDVVGAQIPDSKGGLSSLLGVITERDIAVEYLYAFLSTSIGKAYVIFRVEDNAGVEELLTEKGFKLLSNDDIK